MIKAAACRPMSSERLQPRPQACVGAFAFHQPSRNTEEPTQMEIGGTKDESECDIGRPQGSPTPNVEGQPTPKVVERTGARDTSGRNSLSCDATVSSSTLVTSGAMVSSPRLATTSSIFSSATLPAGISTRTLSTSTPLESVRVNDPGFAEPCRRDRFRDVGCQTTVSLPTRVSAMWQCHCPEANTVVDKIVKEPRPSPASPSKGTVGQLRRDEQGTRHRGHRLGRQGCHR